MKRLALILALAIATPALAQDGDPPPPEEGLNLVEEAMRLFMRGLLAEMEPALDDLRGLLSGIDDYHAPQMLPNGDILIRRKTPEEIGESVPDGEIDI